MGIDTVLFDLDGTLLNTLDDLACSMNYALARYGHPVRDKEYIRQSIGSGMDALVRRSLPEKASEEEFQRCRAAFAEHYGVHNNDKTGLYPGVADVIAGLYALGCGMAVISSKPDAFTKELTRGYFGDMIPVAMGGAPGLPKKPAPDALYLAMEALGVTRERCVYVGDSDMDIGAAHNAGIPCVTVTWGFRDREVLEPLGPDYIVDTAEELLRVLQSLA